MKIVWFRAWDSPHGVQVGIETKPGTFEVQMPYDEDGSIRMTTHYFSETTLKAEVARGQWVIERELIV